ncbi:uncharacterized protein DS421_15g493490 [Arachis hypogaea]|nr:uncharacterized protein DS421_15g493490 [Arachis hypogaea]
MGSEAEYNDNTTSEGIRCGHNTLIVDVSNIRVNSELIGRALGIRDGGFAIPELNKKNPAHMAIKEQFKNKNINHPVHGPLDCCREPEPWVIAWTVAELDKKATNVLADESKDGSVKSRHCKSSEKSPPRPIETKELDSHTTPQEETRIGTRKKLPVVRGKSWKGNTATHEAPTCKERPVVSSNSDDDDDEPLAGRGRRLFQDHWNPNGEHINKEASPSAPSENDLVTPSTALVEVIDYDFDRQVQEITICLYVNWPYLIFSVISIRLQLVLSYYSCIRCRNFDLNFVQCPKVEEILVKVEQGRNTRLINMEPLQTVMPKKSRCHTPSPGKTSFSLGLTQLEKSPATPPITTVHSRLKSVRLGEDKEKKVRGWILNSILNKEAPLVTYEGKPHLQLSRRDLWTLKARGWVNSNIIQWMCYTFNDAPAVQFTYDFYCVSPGILHNLDAFHNGPVPVNKGFGPNFGEDTRFFDKVEATKRRWLIVERVVICEFLLQWFIPMCWKGHWWMYAFDVTRKRVLAIDSLQYKELTNERRKLDAYAGRLIEDMGKVAIPTYKRSFIGQEWIRGWRGSLQK